MNSTRGGEQYQFRQGDEVVALDGETIGKVTGAAEDYLLVEKGWLFPKDYQVPVSVIESYDADDGVIFLSVTKDEALTSGWTQHDDDELAGAVGADLDASAPDYTGAAYTAGLETDETYLAADRVMSTGTEHLTVPVHEEELTATTRMREAGEVQIDKRVVAEEQTLEVPVTEERARVTRRTVDRDVTTGEDVFTEETIDVPLRAETVELEKRTRVAEEIEIDKEQIQRTERVSGTVRKEVVDIDEETVTEPEWGTDRRS